METRVQIPALITYYYTDDVAPRLKKYKSLFLCNRLFAFSKSKIVNVNKFELKQKNENFEKKVKIFTVFGQFIRGQSVTQRSMGREAARYPPQYLGP